MRVAICIGHNSKYQGAVFNNEISEYSFNKPVAKFLEKFLIESGIEAFIVERPPIKSYTDQIEKQQALINSKGGCSVAVELHFNAGGGSGAEVLSSGSEESLKISNEILEEIVEEYSIPNRGVKVRKSGNGALFLMSGEHASLIVEPFFSDNPNNLLAILGSNGFDEFDQKRLARCYARGICRYFGVELKETKPIQKSRTIKGGFASLLGGLATNFSVISQEFKNLGDLTGLQYLIIVSSIIVIAGSAITIYARIDDFKKGVK